MARNAHYLVAKTAREMAEELYELWAMNNEVYAATKGKKGRAAFIARIMPKMLEDARQTLTSMLGREDVAEREKEQIYEALMLDNALRANRPVAASVARVPRELH